MRTYFLLLLLCANSLFAFSQTKKNMPRLKGFKKVELSGKIYYVAQTEVTNQQWVEFIKATGGPSLEDQPVVANPFNRCVSDLFFSPEVIYRDTTWLNEKGRKKNFKVACGQMPITGISFDQAQLYCQYLNKKYAADWPTANFRLPSPQEMTALLAMQVASFDELKRDIENPYKKGVNEKRCIVFNHSHDSWCENNRMLKNAFGYAVPFPVKWAFPNENGLFELQGNVAEMTAVKGIAMGGSCKHVAADCQPGVQNRYDGPAYWVGFRVLSEIK